MSSSSKSKTYTTTTTQQFDKRILAESGSFVIGSDAMADLSTEFGENVAAAYNSLIDFAGEIAGGAADIVTKALEKTTEQIGKTATETTQVLASELQSKTTGQISAVTKWIPYIAIAFFVVAGVAIVRRSK